MNNHLHAPPPPPPPSASSGLNSQTTAQILTHAASVFLSHPITFLTLSLLLLTFRSNVETGTHLLTTFIDNDPSLRPLLSRLDTASAVTTTNPHSSASTPRRRRRPFLHLTRVGTLDDDFFSGDEDAESRRGGHSSLFGPRAKPAPNGTFVILGNFESRLGFSPNYYVPRGGISVSGSGIAGAGNGVRASGSGIRRSGDEIRGSGDETRVSDNGIRVSDNVIGVSGNGKRVSGSRIGDSDDEIRITESRIGSSDDEIRVSDSGIGDSDDEIRISASGIGSSDDEIRVSDNGITAREIVKSGFSLKLVNSSLQSVDDSENGGLGKVENSRILDLHFLTKGLELRPLVLLICLLSTAYGYVLLGFLVTYSWVLGIVFVVVVNHFLGRRRSWFGTVWGGSILGLKRASGFVLMRWAVRDALSQLLGLWFFGEVDDQYSFFKIFLRLKLMPFSLTNQWVRGFEKETAGFLFAWILSDMVVEFFFAVDSWVAIVDSRRSGREIMKEGFYLLSTMFKQAGVMKCLEFMLCGSFTRWTLARYFGMLFATACQSIVEVYFMVAWLIFYFAVRSKDATSLGRTFGQRELEGFVQGQR
ncbi:hypothetical protein RHSIM_Rhsim04G0145100 [Rhododendron simsii]|uniref:Transmembrane protein n=1 Tax=Rhododendron simsii TaxID=118357 RepID=A0A834H659_RHOSS|nr:hypothetical protein RHSIM_Rhsim04G0145100 [Rhododendron simsii]